MATRDSTSTATLPATVPSTLRNYRRLFIEQGLDELLFRCLTDRLVQGFSVDTSHQRMDSTALRSAMRALTRLGIVVESISKFARELERYHPGLHEQISKEVIRRYVDREGNGAFANTAPSVSKRRLGEAGQDLLALVLQFRDTAAAKLSSFAILERVLRDQFEIVDDECGDRDAKRAAIRDPKDVPCDKEAFKLRAEIVERSFAHNLDRGGMRRTWLRGRENVHKRYLLHVAGHNLSLLMRKLIGAGTPREAVAGGYGCICVLIAPAGAVLVAQMVLIVSEDGETAFVALCFAVE